MVYMTVDRDPTDECQGSQIRTREINFSDLQIRNESHKKISKINQASIL